MQERGKKTRFDLKTGKKYPRKGGRDEREKGEKEEKSRQIPFCKMGRNSKNQLARYIQ